MADNVNALPALPAGSTANNVPSHLDLLKDAINAGSIIRRLSGAAIAALSGVELTAGTVVYNTTTGKLQISNGSAFTDVIDPSAYATAAQGTKADNAAAKASNLSDLANAATARSNLGLGTAATTAASAYATAAQGTKADNALPAYRIQAGYHTVPGEGPNTVAYPIFGAGQPVVVASPVENGTDKWVVVGNVGTSNFTYRTNVGVGSLISWIAVFP